MGEALLREKILAVKEELGASATHLDKVLSDIETVQRAEKTAISEVTRKAFDRLNAAREHLEELENLLEKELR